MSETETEPLTPEQTAKLLLALSKVGTPVAMGLQDKIIDAIIELEQTSE